MIIARISCNKFSYSLPTGDHKGSNLRSFFGVKKTHDLFVESESDDDIIIEPKLAYFIEDGDKFYTVHRRIL